MLICRKRRISIVIPFAGGIPALLRTCTGGQRLPHSALDRHMGINGAPLSRHTAFHGTHCGFFHFSVKMGCCTRELVVVLPLEFKSDKAYVLCWSDFGTKRVYSVCTGLPLRMGGQSAKGLKLRGYFSPAFLCLFTICIEAHGQQRCC